jgi:hypothetical protein
MLLLTLTVQFHEKNHSSVASKFVKLSDELIKSGRFLHIFVAFSEYLSLISSMHIMAIPVVEFSREGYKIRKVFG